ncbi:MAG: Dabb family protein [Acidobacteriota bacterium]
MITHIVCWKYGDGTTAGQRTEHIGQLSALPNTIPEIVSFEVGPDILHLERSFDTGLVAVFADRAALDRYNDHPEHQKVAAFGREIAEKVVSVDFLSEPPAVAGG